MAIEFIANDSFLFRDKLDFRIDSAKILGELASDKTSREICSNSNLFTSTSIVNGIQANIITPRIRIENIVDTFWEKNEDDVKFALTDFDETENLTFKSIYARIAAERERVSLALLALCAKIQSLFRRLSLIQFAILLIISCRLFSPQFGGSRNLPVA